MRRHFHEVYSSAVVSRGMRKVMEVEGGIKRWNQVKQFVEKGERRGEEQNDSSSSCFSHRRRKGGRRRKRRGDLAYTHFADKERGG